MILVLGKLLPGMNSANSKTLGLDFVATSSASVLANFVTHPAETIKTRQQLNNVTAAQVLRDARASGAFFGSLYRGFSASIIRAIISGGGRQTIYYGLKISLLSRDNTSGIARAALGVLAGVLAAGLAAPIDLVRTRQQGEALAGRGPSVLAILKRVYKDEGGIRGLYRGSSAVFARQALLNGSQLASYDRAKAAISSWTGYHADGIVTQAAAAAIAGGIATAAIAPVEYVKTQMQSGGRGSMMHIALSVARRDGVIALWRGSGALWAKLAPHTLIVLLTTDAFRVLLGIPLIL